MNRLLLKFESVRMYYYYFKLIILFSINILNKKVTVKTFVILQKNPVLNMNL